MNQAGMRRSGYVALAATVLLWASFALSSRAIGASTLTEYDAALVRFAVPLLVLAPLLRRAFRALTRERTATVTLLLAGGLPHYLLFALGARLTSAGLTGLLVPGTVPLFVTLLLLGQRRVPARAWAALGAIVAGVVASATMIGEGAGPGGIGVLLLAGAVWAVYTLGLQRTALTPLEIVVAVCAGSTLALLALVASGLAPSHLVTGSVQPGDLVSFVVLQGIGTGLLSTLCYTHAVRALGGGVAAVGGALSPVVTAVAAVPLFGEGIGPGLAVALVLVVAGVLGFNGVGFSTSHLTNGLRNRSIRNPFVRCARNQATSVVRDEVRDQPVELVGVLQLRPVAARVDEVHARVGMRDVGEVLGAL